MTDEHEDPAARSLKLELLWGIAPLIRLMGKVPFDYGWTKGVYEDPEYWRRLLRGWTHDLGMVCGRLMTGMYLVVVDADARVEGWRDSLDRLHELGLPKDTVTVLTGGGGVHLYFLSPFPIVKGALVGFPGIDIQGVDAQVVIPYSMHESGVRYEYEFGYGPEDIAIAELPQSILNLLVQRERVTTATTRHDPTDDDERVLALLESHYGAHSAVWHGHYYSVTRPGKERGVSATIGEISKGGVHCFTSAWPPLEMNANYDEHALYKLKGVPDPLAEAVKDIAASIKPAPAPTPTLIRHSDVRSRRQTWLWHNMIPAGQFVIAAGPEKLGKSVGLVRVAARATRGLLSGDYKGEPMNVVYVSSEDDADRTLKPRAEVAGVDGARMFYMHPEVVAFNPDVLVEVNAGLVILDPMSSYVRISNVANEHGEMAIRQALQPFMQLARDLDVTVLGVRHTRKATTTDNALDAVLGSRAWTAAARGILVFCRDKEAGPGHGFLFARGNLAREQGGKRYYLEGVPAVLDDGTDAEVPRFVLDGGVTGLTLEEVLSGGHRGEAQQGAETFLLDYLGDGAEHFADATYAAALSAGHARRTVERAATALGVRRKRSGFGAPMAWSLPFAKSANSDPYLAGGGNVVTPISAARHVGGLTGGDGEQAESGGNGGNDDDEHEQW